MHNNNNVLGTDTAATSFNDLVVFAEDVRTWDCQKVSHKT